MPVIHHLQLCCKDIHETLKILRRYGFVPFAKRETAICKQVATRLSSIVFIVSEKTRGFKTHNKLLGSIRNENYLVLCSRCENEESNDDDTVHVDTVFNVALNVKNVNSLTDRVKMHDASSVIHPPSVVKDNNGEMVFSIIKSICGNVVHTLLNLENYHGYFLPGFTEISNVNIYDDTYSTAIDLVNSNITHVDHVTLACHSGYSGKIIQYYENAFGMEKFKISRYVHFVYIFPISHLFNFSLNFNS